MDSYQWKKCRLLVQQWSPRIPQGDHQVTAIWSYAGVAWADSIRKDCDDRRLGLDVVLAEDLASDLANDGVWSCWKWQRMFELPGPVAIMMVSSTVLCFQVMVPLGMSVCNKHRCIEWERNVPDSLRFSSRSLKPVISSSCMLPSEETDTLLTVVSAVVSAMEMNGHWRQSSQYVITCNI